MSEFIEVNDSVPVVGQTDVLVIGGGIAGVSAALASKRKGMKVTLIEKGVALGGLATLGHVCIYLGLCDGAGNRIYAGLAEELLHLSIKYGYNNLPSEWKRGVKHVDNPTGRYRTHFNIPAFILALDEIMQQEGIDVVFDSVFSSPIMEGKECKGAVIENKSGRSAYMAKVIVDATGDADVFYRAGAQCLTQESIVSHWCYELDFATMKEGIEQNDMLKAIGLRWLGLRPDADNSEATIPTFSGTTSEGVNGYIKLSRSLALDYLKKNQRGDYAMLTIPFAPQFRTTRRIKGLKEFDFTPDKFVESSVGCVCNCIKPNAPVYEFPYEALIDCEITNIIAAGRMVAAAGQGWELMRFIPACAQTGEAAGVAAALSIKNNTTLQNVDISTLQKQLEECGIMVHMDECVKGNKGKDNKIDPKSSTESMIKADALSYH